MHVPRSTFDVSATYRNFGSTFLVSCTWNPNGHISVGRGDYETPTDVGTELPRSPSSSFEHKHAPDRHPHRRENTHPSLSDFMNDYTHASLGSIPVEFVLEKAHKADQRRSATRRRTNLNKYSLILKMITSEARLASEAYEENNVTTTKLTTRRISTVRGLKRYPRVVVS